MKIILRNADGVDRLEDREEVSRFEVFGEEFAVHRRLGMFGVSHVRSGFGIGEATSPDPEAAQAVAVAKLTKVGEAKVLKAVASALVIRNEVGKPAQGGLL